MPCVTARRNGGNSRLQSLARGFDHRQLFVGIGIRIAMTRKVFPAGHDFVVLQPRRRRQSQLADHVGRRPERAVADNRIVRIAVHIEHRRHIHVHAHCPQLFGNGCRSCVGQFGGIAATQQVAGRENRKTRGKTGDPTTLLIDGNQQRRMGATGLEIVRQIDHLFDGFEVSREQNDTARLVFFNERGQVAGYRGAEKPDHKELSDFVMRRHTIALPCRHSGEKLRVAQPKNIPIGCTNSPPSKAAASEEARRMLRYVELLSNARTPLADFFSILLQAPINQVL